MHTHPSVQPSIEALRDQLVRALQRSGYSIATAESCTLGAVAATVGVPAGASAWLRGGIIAYQTELKAQLLGIPRDFIEQHHVVSEAVACAMAEAAAKRLGATLGIGTTGLAGPSGADETHPVGLVCIAASLQSPVPHTISQSYHFTGDRASITNQATAAALSLALRLIEQAFATASSPTPTSSAQSATL